MLLCPSCGRDNPADARFCNTCGTALTSAPQARKERKFATALFADLVGSTALAEREDPEVVQSVVGRTCDRLAEEIGGYEGLLEKLMGDAVLAVFGVPKAHEDDAERAVRAGLEMQAPCRCSTATWPSAGVTARPLRSSSGRLQTRFAPITSRAIRRSFRTARAHSCFWAIGNRPQPTATLRS